MTPYEESVTILARLALVITVVVLVGGWLLALAVSAWKAWRARHDHQGGDVPPVTDWTSRPNDFNRDWYRR